MSPLTLGVSRTTMGDLVPFSNELPYKAALEEDLAELLTSQEVALDMQRLEGYAIVLIVDGQPVTVYNTESRSQLFAALHIAAGRLLNEEEEE